MSGFYLDDVVGVTPYPNANIDILNTKNIGPLYREGSLAIDNTGAPDILTLDGTIYIAGDLTFQQPGISKTYTLDLNNQTIFVEGSIYFPPARCIIYGEGCIIAIGDINFQPMVTASFDQFVFVMSLDGMVDFHPQGDFSGSIAGECNVYLAPGNTCNWVPYPEDPETPLNFPGFDETDPSGPSTSLSILSWQIK